MTGGLTALAGCAAEPIDETDADSADEDDGEEGADGTEEGATEESDEGADNISGNDESDSGEGLVNSMPEADGMLEVSEMQIEGGDGADEWIELTNVGDDLLDLSGWRVQDRYDDGMVDGRGFDPAIFPNNFILELGESMRIVTGPGEDTDDTIHWGYDQQIWNEDGDMVVVLDHNGEAVLESEIGSGGEGDPGNANGGNGNGNGNGGNGNGNGNGNGDPEEPPLSDISIGVVDPDGAPIGGATVHGEGEPHEADIPLEFDGETVESGYHHNTIYENSYTIEIDHPDYESTVIEHTHDGETEVTVELEPVAEEPPTSEITIWVVDSDGNPIEGAEIVGQGDPHEADIPLEFDGETNADGVHSTPIYQNSYTIDVDHPDYFAETVEHVHDGETEITVELEPEDDDDDDDDEAEGEPEIAEYEIVDDGRGYAMVEGVVANNSETDLAEVSVEVWLYNADGQQIGHSLDGMTSLGAGDEWPFEIGTAVEMEELEDHEIELDYREYR